MQHSVEQITPRGSTLTNLNEMMTPWRRVFRRFNFPSQSAFARAIDQHRSKVSRALSDPKGLISGADQERILRAAREHKVQIKPEDLVPSEKAGR